MHAGVRCAERAGRKIAVSVSVVAVVVVVVGVVGVVVVVFLN